MEKDRKVIKNKKSDRYSDIVIGRGIEGPFSRFTRIQIDILREKRKESAMKKDSNKNANNKKTEN